MCVAVWGGCWCLGGSEQWAMVLETNTDSKSPMVTQGDYPKHPMLSRQPLCLGGGQNTGDQSSDVQCQAHTHLLRHTHTNKNKTKCKITPLYCLLTFQANTGPTFSVKTIWCWFYSLIDPPNPCLMEINLPHITQSINESINQSMQPHSTMHTCDENEYHYTYSTEYSRNQLDNK